MSPTSTSDRYHFRCPTGGEHISRLVETRRGKKTFLQSKNFLLMRYKFLSISPLYHSYEVTYLRDLSSYMD
jgi:hypothetical protein